MDDLAIVGTVTDSIRELLASDDAVARDYLKASFLSSAMIALFYARRKAGLTQAQVAERMGTKQSGIARMEADSSGATSLRRYVEYALACDMLPLNMVLDSVESIREYARANPDADRSAGAYAAWRARGKPREASPSERQPSADPDPLLPEPTIKEALDEAAACEKESARATILKLLVPNLSPRTSPPLLEQALGLAQEIVDNRLRASVLFALAARLPQPLQSEAKAEADRAIEIAARQIVTRYA